MALTVGSRIVFLAGAVVFVAYAFLAESVVDIDVPAVVLALPLVPLGIAAVMVRDSITDARANSGPSRPGFGTMPAATEASERAGTPTPFGADGAGVERLLAASPYATPTELSELAYAHPELRPAIASNPSSPASLLQWLTEQGEPAVLAAISARGAVLR
ncbi:hypothetical protein [Demequina sp.]|uniref:variant leucine-rich repeat-containing protein n=1 Tax=Demequina sp. TaxID=2050685 RepID=UPI0025F6D5AA|nr:hypothetical protein [Demequina sp.]